MRTISTAISIIGSLVCKFHLQQSFLIAGSLVSRANSARPMSSFSDRPVNFEVLKNDGLGGKGITLAPSLADGGYENVVRYISS